MTQEELRKFIETILFDVRGDNPSPEDIILQANASLILHKVNTHVGEVIGEPDENLPADEYQIEEELIAEQRKRAGL